MKKARWTAVAGASLLASIVSIRTMARPGADGAAPAAPEASPVVLSAPGRVEGVREARALTPGIDGVVREVMVHEGDRVHGGQIVARIDCADLEAEEHTAAAAVDVAVAARARLLRGGRDDVQAEAQAQVRAAEARLANATLSLDRAARLYNDERIVARSVVDDAELAERVARAELEAARQHAQTARAEPLPEERAAADSAASAAGWARITASARLRKCAVSSPIDGVVLRRHLEPGERIGAASPQPIVTISDLSSLRVRVEVDERDVAAVRLGDPVRITAEALGQASVGGVVARVSPEMGRKRVRTGDPAEKADRDVLEVLVDVTDRHPALVYGLRVTALFLRR
jgi:HlyD family secretion protein